MAASPNGAFNYLKTVESLPVAGYICQPTAENQQSAAVFHTLLTPCAQSGASQTEYYLGAELKVFDSAAAARFHFDTFHCKIRGLKCF